MINNIKKITVVMFFMVIISYGFLDVRVVKASQSTDKFVTEIYRNALSREPDSGGLAYWSQQLATNKVSASTLVRKFIESDEFKSKNLSNTQYINVLYKSVQGRDYDKDGQAWWIEQLNSGYSRLRVLVEFLNSPEFAKRCEELGIAKGKILLTDPIDTRPDAVNFVSKLYRNCLNREPDGEGLKFYVSAIANNKMTGAGLVEAFMLCPEFINRNISNDEFIKIIYNSFYNRQPDISGLNSWINALNTGYTRKRVLASIIDTAEFKSNITKYRIPLGNIAITEAIDRRPDLVGFVTRLYNKVYNRQPDLDGLKYHVSRLDSKTVTAAEFIESFIFTSEFKNMKLNYTNYINILYRSIYGRDADKDGMSYWLQQLYRGYSERWVLSGFVASGEFQQLSDRYGLNRGQIITNENDVIQNGYFIYSNYNITFNEFVSKQIGNTPALSVNGEWRYAQIQNGEQGYYIETSAGRQWYKDLQQYNAIKQEIINKADPNILAKDSTQIYQFIKLSYIDGILASDLNSIFLSSGVLNGKGQVFMDAAKKFNVNPVYLAAHAIHETGNGTSKLARGITVNGVKVYNLFGIGAVDGDPEGAGSRKAYEKGWDTIDKAIYGGAEWISNGYINAGQDTLYKMRWNPIKPTVHQYATDVRWAYGQAFKYKSLFDSLKNIKLVFDIPIFK